MSLYTYDHPAQTHTHTCRHCGQTTGPDPEICINCGPVCETCFNLDCPIDLENQARKLFTQVMTLLDEADQLRLPKPNRPQPIVSKRYNQRKPK